MCITPVVVLGLAKKSGKTANTHIENINNLSYLMQQAANNKDKIKGEDFLRTTIEDLIKKTKRDFFVVWTENNTFSSSAKGISSPSRFFLYFRKIKQILPNFRENLSVTFQNGFQLPE